jgi:trk system potassium uptake protein
MQLRSTLFALGIMCMFLGAAMVPSALLDIAAAQGHWPIFVSSAFAVTSLGAALYVLTRGDQPPRTSQREAFLLTVLVWSVLPGLAAVPFMSWGMSFTDAMFESISGLTTTGSTVLTGLSELPRGLLLWRAVLQWFGGIGIIVTAIAILPQLRVGGMQLFQLESSDQSGKFLPRVTQIAMETGLIYLLLTVICAILYLQTGIGDAFSAVTHAMTTMAAGGYSIHDNSFGEYSGTAAPWVAIVFMTIAGLPFSLLAMAVFHNRWSQLRDSPQPRLFLALIIILSASLLAWLMLGADRTVLEDDTLRPVRDTIFNIVSIMTGTGYATAPYDTWGTPAIVIFLFAMFLGGCAGSAACGIKMFRLEISAKAVLAHSRRMVQPHRLVPVRYDGRVVDEDTLQSVMVFVFLYLATFITASVLLSLLGLDAITALSGAATSVSNVGPGLGSVIGPDGTFQTLPEAAKWVCASAMLLGRLEFVAVFVVLSRRFWAG